VSSGNPYLERRLVGLFLVGSIVGALAGTGDVVHLLARRPLGGRGLAALRSFGHGEWSLCGLWEKWLFCFGLYCHCVEVKLLDNANSMTQ